MKRTIKPTLRPIRADLESISASQLTAADFGQISAGTLAGSSDAEATERARAYRCPSHGRQRGASAVWSEDGWTISGLCCDRAIAAVRAELDG